MTAAQKIVEARTQKTIKPRRMAFDMTELREKYFFRGNPILSTLMYSLSASFPDGERFFIDTVRHYQKDIKDPALIAQIRGFIGQFILLWNDRKMPSWAHIREAWHFMWGEGGFRSWAAPEFKRYLKTGFHPNDIDQNHLIEQWHENYPEVAALQVA